MFRGLTSLLAYSSKPPIGANMIPMAKKRGSTVLGVRIGLENGSQPQDYMEDDDLAGHGVYVERSLPCFQTLLPKRGIWIPSTYIRRFQV